MAGEIRTKREAAQKRWGQLETERSSWMTHWRELVHNFAPRSGRFFNTNASGSPNRGDKKHQHIYDNTPLRSLHVLEAGLMAGMTSPARPWFRLRTPDDGLNDREPVRRWLHEVERRMRNVFAQSNTYRSLRKVYKQLGMIGTAADIVLPDFDSVIHNYPLTVGEYAVDVDAKGNVNTLYRKFEMNSGQLVTRFGYDRVSVHVKNQYDNGNLTPWHTVLHVIEPRRERDPLKLSNTNMPFASCYYETAAREDEYLRMSGYRRFPAVVPRWETEGQDVYGQSPGMTALGDAKQLQHQQLRKAQGIDFKTLPPLQVPTSGKQGINLTPGKVNYMDVASQGARPLIESNLDLDHLLADIHDVRYRIKQAFFEDLFLMITAPNQGGGIQPVSAREIAERHEEKLLMLGPVLESLHDELLSPLVEMTFAYMLEAGIIPPPPRELQGMPLVVQFVSLLAQAQQLVGLGGVERLLGTVVNVAQIKPDIMDKLNTDEVVDVYADILGVDPDLVVADDQVAMVRATRAQQQAAMAAAEAAPGVAQATKTFSEVDNNRNGAGNSVVNALNQLGGA